VVGPNSGGEHRDNHAARIEPALVRVSVLGGNTQLDVGLPAAVPVALLIGEVVAQIQSRVPVQRDPDVESSTQPPERAHRWTLALVGQEPLAPNRTLSESGVRDGDLLMLQSVDTGESPVLFDDVVDAVASATTTRPSWAARHSQRLALAVTMCLLIGLPLSPHATRDTLRRLSPHWPQLRR